MGYSINSPMRALVLVHRDAGRMTQLLPEAYIKNSVTMPFGGTKAGYFYNNQSNYSRGRGLLIYV